MSLIENHLPLYVTGRPWRLNFQWDEDKFIAWAEEHLRWQGRDDYLAWLAEWKTRLHEDIAEIRKQKAIRRDKTRTIEDRNYANWERQRLRTECRNLMLLRRIGKQMSARQRTEKMATVR